MILFNLLVSTVATDINVVRANCVRRAFVSTARAIEFIQRTPSTAAGHGGVTSPRGRV